jgi:hypothetical protein
MGIPRLDSPQIVRLSGEARVQPQLARLLLLLAGAASRAKRWAIGGGVAVRDAGYRRYTEDLDVFATEVSARKIVKGLRAEGVEIRWLGDYHAIAFLEEDNRDELAAKQTPTIRIDVLATLEEPEAGAIRTAVPARTLGVEAKVFRADYLAAIKFLAGRPQDLLDFDELMRLGTDVDRVKYLVSTSDDSKVPALLARIRAQREKPKGVRDGAAARYLDRDALDAAWKASEAKRAAR